tara:strand:- start:399 stop:635 length:237 start_codon:yes stop_codon:yes gene_type:complete
MDYKKKYLKYKAKYLNTKKQIKGGGPVAKPDPGTGRALGSASCRAKNDGFGAAAASTFPISLMPCVGLGLSVHPNCVC